MVFPFFKKQCYCTSEKRRNSSPCKKLSKKTLTVISLFILLFSFGACKTTQPSGYASYESRIVAKEGHYVIIRTQGRGTSKAKAVESAMSNAIQDVLFKNLSATYGDHRILQPVVNDPREKEKHPNVFKNLLDYKDNYTKFIGKCDAKKEEYKTGETRTVVMNIAVDREALREYMQLNAIPTNR
ncbi:MAG: hypothetical protein K2K84_01905 [Muribaculaceae bacterium]|nr:hypothetical protein [Muribaculaceae bacterium]